MQRSDLPRSDGVALSRVGIMALLACGIFPTIGLFSPGLVLPQIAQHFAQTANASLLTEMVGTLASFTFALGAPVAGALIARWGCRTVILPCLVVFALAGAAPAFLDDLSLILIARAVLGLALGGIFTGSLAGLGCLPHVRRAKMFGWFSVVGGAAAVLMFPAVGALGHYGWRPAFLVNLLALPAILLAMRIPAGLAIAARHRVEDASVEHPSRHAPALINPAMAGLLAVAVLAGMAMLIGPIYAPLHLGEMGITDTRQTAIPVTIGSVAGVFASGAFGWLHARLGATGVTALSLLATSAVLILAGITGSVMVFSGAVIVQSALIALIAPNVSASAMEYSAPGKAPQAMGLANGVMFGAHLLFPFVAAPIRAAGGLQGVFFAFAATTLIAGGVALLRTRGRAAQSARAATTCG